MLFIHYIIWIPFHPWVACFKEISNVILAHRVCNKVAAMKLQWIVGSQSCVEKNTQNMCKQDHGFTQGGYH